MKKILMAGALAASMLASSSAFAAGLTVGVSEDKLTVTADTNAIMTAEANVGKQMTVVVVDGDGSTVSTDTIRYIDQGEAKAGLFESMGVLLRPTKEVDADGNPIMETALPDGIYTVKIGGEDIAAPDLYVGTLIIPEEGSGEKVKFVFGDVNGTYDPDTMAGSPIDAVNAVDASVILGLSAGLDVAAGGAYSIGTLVEDLKGNKFVFGDVNGTYDPDTMAGSPIDAVNAVDASVILGLSAGLDVAAGGAYSIGEIVEVNK